MNLFIVILNKYIFILAFASVSLNVCQNLETPKKGEIHQNSVIHSTEGQQKLLLAYLLKAIMKFTGSKSKFV